MSDAPDKASFFRRRLPSQGAVSVGFAIIFLVLAVNALMLYQNMRTLRRHQTQLRQSNALVHDVEAVLSDMKDAETGQRGFQITGVESFLEPLQQARAQILDHLTALREAARAHPDQLLEIKRLDERIAEAMRWLDTAVETRRAQGLSAGLAMFTSHGKQLMDNIRASVQLIRNREEANRSQYQEAVDDSSTAVDHAFAFVTVSNLLLTWVGYIFVRRSLRQQTQEAQRQANEAWLRSGLSSVKDALLGDFDLASLGHAAVSAIAKLTDLPLVNLYTSKKRMLHLAGAYGSGDVNSGLSVPQQVPFGIGLTGTAAAEQRPIHLQTVPVDYLRVTSSTGASAPGHVLILPLTFQGEVKGVLEVAGFTAISPLLVDLLSRIGESLGISIDAAETRTDLQHLLEQTQHQAEQLQAQQEELRVGNEELEIQAVALREARDVQQVQQEELRQTNEELEQQARALEAQKEILLEKNRQLEEARRDVEAKAKELEISGRYKSEFLANMSHELRTPLNSLLILATLLFENERGHLDEKEVEFARTIHRAGGDLLNLINDILDLSKVEAGKLDLHQEAVELSALCNNLSSTFQPLAGAKFLHFEIHLDPALPHALHTDGQRLEQILRNFLSNAVKFTARGSVSLSVRPVHNSRGGIAFSVKDTGIGIPEGSIESIFTAFQQLDGSTAREFGGTGLGLTISRELATLLGGTIEVSSTPGAGSIFTLFMPLSTPERTASPAATTPPAKDPPRVVQHRDLDPAKALPSPNHEQQASPQPETIVGGDVADLTANDKIMLIIEDDPVFAKTLIEVAHERGFKALSVGDGGTGLALLERQVVHAVVLDVKLPDVSGMSVLERIKSNPRTRHLPIHMISGVDHTQNALQLGAVGYLVKPVSIKDLRESFARIEEMILKAVKKVLIVEDDTVQRQAVSQLIGGRDIETTAVGTGAEAMALLLQTNFDCVIMDLRLPDISGFDLLEQIDRAQLSCKPPVVIYTGKDLNKGEISRLQQYSESIVIKGARSPERLLDEVSLFLHRVEADLPQDRQAMLRALREKEKIFANRRILIVDDDMRNVFALANALERHGLKIQVARDGQEALDKLATDTAIDLVLMDIMMPQMDGYTAMRAIRHDLRLRKLPVIALTAKAMKGDQERCVEAGASDYLPKPVDLERLLSLLRVWLPQGDGI